MLIDMHAHSSALSHCCWIDYKEVIDITLEHDIDGIVLTNHYEKLYVEKFGGIDNFLKAYIDEFYAAEKYGKEKGCRVFFGIEISMTRYPRVHMLVYGVTPDFLIENPYVFELTQEELFSLVKSYGGILVQGHPFRGGTTVLDTKFLDGVEVNCHPRNGPSCCDELLKIAKENNLFVTCGGDFHAVAASRPKCGTYFPDDIEDIFQLKDYLLSTDKTKLCVQEPGSEDYFIVYSK